MSRICTLIFIFLLYCTPANASELIPLRLAVLPVADTLPLHVAKDEGIFAGHGLDVTLIPFQSALEQSSALRGATLDGQFTDIVRVLLQNDTGIPQTIIATTSRTMPSARFFGFAVAGDSDIRTLADLNHTQVAVGTATIVDFMRDCFINDAKLPETALVTTNIHQMPIRMQMLATGQIASAILPEPLLSLAEKRGARILWDDSNLDEVLAVIAVRPEWLGEGEQRAEAFRAAFAEAVKRINAAPEKYQQLMLKKRLLPRGAEDIYRLPPLDVRQIPYGLPTAENLKSYINWMQKEKLLKTTPDCAALVR